MSARASSLRETFTWAIAPIRCRSIAVSMRPDSGAPSRGKRTSCAARQAACRVRTDARQIAQHRNGQIVDVNLERFHAVGGQSGPRAGIGENHRRLRFDVHGGPPAFRRPYRCPGIDTPASDHKFDRRGNPRASVDPTHVVHARTDPERSARDRDLGTKGGDARELGRQTPWQLALQLRQLDPGPRERDLAGPLAIDRPRDFERADG
jgi:hypothetical protein